MESADALGSDVRVAFVQRFVFVAVPGEALRVKPALFGETTSPEEAVVRLVHLVAFTQRLIREVAA